MKITFLLSRFPWPLDKGDKLRAYYQMKQLAKVHEISLMTLTDKEIPQKDINQLFEFCTGIQVFKITTFSKIINISKAFITGKPLQVGYFYNSKIDSIIEKTLDVTSPDVVFCQLVRMAEYGKNADGIRILDYQDALSAGIKRRMDKVGFFFRQILRIEHKRLQQYENQVFDKFDKLLIITQTDRNLIPHPKKDSIQILPNGVDTAHFYPREKAKEFELIFAGNMNYPPNVDAAQYLAKKIMPMVWKAIPEAKLVLAGAHPAHEVQKLQNSQIQVTGWVNDIADAYASARVFVAPMRIGTGLQNKLLEAMAMKMPTVTTSLANDALGAKTGEAILVGNSANEIADIIIKLLSDNELYDTIARNGYKFIKENYSWNEVGKKLESFLVEPPIPR